jgi:hypothetical protein
MSSRLRAGLASAAEDMAPVRLAPDTWMRGRRARRRARLRSWGATSVVLLLVAVVAVVTVAPRRSAEPFGDGGDRGAVPNKLETPWMWQATVQGHPPGRARLLFGGDACCGLHGIDVVDSRGKLAVVGAGGTTRMLLYDDWGSVGAGEDVLLSPDGIRVVQPYLENSGTPGGGLILTNLTDGRSLTVAGSNGPGCCLPVAWSSDGNALLALQLRNDVAADGRGVGTHDARYVFVNLGSNVTIPLSDYSTNLGRRTASRGAYVPGGGAMVITEGTTLRMVDNYGTHRWSRDLGPRRFLAGVGAFTPDTPDIDWGKIATVTLDGCLDDCDERELAARRWTISYLEPYGGRDAEAHGLPTSTITGSALRALGWHGRDLITLVYSPARGAHKDSATTPNWNDTGRDETGHVKLVAVRADGTTSTLLDPPDGVLSMDVPLDLISAGRFSGPSSQASVFPARPVLWLLTGIVFGLVLTVGTAVTVSVRRSRQRRRNRRDPS